MKYLSVLGALFLFIASLSAQQQQTTHTVFFEFDDHALTPQARKALDRLITELAKAPEYQVEIEAHTDDRGSERYNRDLAERRADAVLNFLTQRDILVERTTVRSFGESRPAYANDDEQSRQLNRRVDVIVTRWSYDSVDELLGRMEGESVQYFTLDPNRNTRVTGREGTSIWIPAGSLALPDGSTPEGEVQVSLEEAYSPDDMLLKGLHTTAGEQLLETGGMIRVEATSGGQALQLRDGAALTVGMPAAELQEGMELFNGVTDAEGQLVDWQPAGQSFSSELAGTLDLPPPPVRPSLLYFPPIYRPNLQGEPREPAPPQRPFKPHEPRRESFQYNPGFFKRLFTGKEAIEAREEADYRQALAEYEQKLLRYEERKIAYQKELEAYREAYAAYDEAHAAWEKRLEAERKNWRNSPAYQAAIEKGQKELELQLEIWRKKYAEWEAAREARLLEFEQKYDAVGNLDAASVKNYFYEVNTLGWINCDRFYDVPEEERMPLVIQDSDDAEERIYVVFESLNSIVSTFKRDQQYLTQGLPKDARVKVIGIKVTEGRPQLALTEMVVADSREKPLALNYEACKLSDIRKALAQLN